jgi:hydrogenase maturation protease
VSRSRDKYQLPGENVTFDTPARETLIVGLGNPLRGDDGVGVRIVQLLAAQELPDGVEVVDGGTQGLELVSLMEGWEQVILVDAANVGKTHGEFVRFRLDEARLLGSDEQVSVHAAGLRDALLLAQALQVLPEEVVIYGVQPANLDWDAELSPQVEAAIPEIIGCILDELDAKELSKNNSQALPVNS